MCAENAGKTVSELYPDSEPGRVFRNLAEMISSLSDDGAVLYSPKPLTDLQLNDLLLNWQAVEGDLVRKSPCNCCKHLGMSSCASRGAAFEAGRVRDLPIIVHGPDCCGYVMSHTQDSHYLSDLDSNIFLVSKMRNNVFCTGMTEKSSIFGGNGDLARTIEMLYGRGRRMMVVLTTCVSGMIGDHVDRVIGDMTSQHPDLKIITVHADGNLSGDSEQGRSSVLRALVDLIKPVSPVFNNRVNIVDDTFIWYSRGFNDRWTNELLGNVGLEPGVKLFEDCAVEEIESCRQNRFSLLADETDKNIALKRLLEEKGLDFQLPTLPKGFRETVEWIRTVGSILNKGSVTEDVVVKIETTYTRFLSETTTIAGKKIDLIMISGTDAGWIIDTLSDSRADVRRIYLLKTRLSTERSTHCYRNLETVPVGRPGEIKDLLSEDPPDLLVSAVNLRGVQGIRTVTFPQECIGYQASIQFLRNMVNILLSDPVEGWKSWGDA